MDHTGGYYMAMAILLALLHRQKTGEGQWVDLACTETALTLHGPALLDWTVNGRPARRSGQPNSNRNQWPTMAPHGIYACAGDDEWIAIACRGQTDWQALSDVVAEDWCEDPTFADLESRLAHQDSLDQQINGWTSPQNKFALAQALQQAGVPASPVRKPQERVEQDAATAEFGLWQTVRHTEMGEVRVDGQPVHLSKTDWQLERGAPCLGEHNEYILTTRLGLSSEEVAELEQAGVI
jgi:crotonobetainyl-CoA:carnitine CoA-transferase CaiB-like acyl-CoA transferase